MWATLQKDASGRTAARRAKPSHCVAMPRRRNWASATPNQAAGLAVQKSGSLKKRGGLPAWVSARLFSSMSMSLMQKKIREEKNARSPDAETRTVSIGLTIFHISVGTFIQFPLGDFLHTITETVMRLQYLTKRIIVLKLQLFITVYFTIGILFLFLTVY